MKSMQDKLRAVESAALQLAGLIDAGWTPTSDEQDLIYSYAEGLSGQRIRNCVNGRCSLQASLNFDMQAEETEIERDLATLKTLREKAGPEARKGNAKKEN